MLPAPRTNQLQPRLLPPHPQLQLLALLINLHPIHPVSRPSQNPRPVVFLHPLRLAKGHLSEKAGLSGRLSDSCAEPICLWVRVQSRVELYRVDGHAGNRNELRKALTGSGQQALALARGLENSRHSLATNYDEALRQALQDAHVTLRPRPESLDTPNQVSLWIDTTCPTPTKEPCERYLIGARWLLTESSFKLASMQQP